jgi:hypothetical protein
MADAISDWAMVRQERGVLDAPSDTASLCSVERACREVAIAEGDGSLDEAERLRNNYRAVEKAIVSKKLSDT